MEAKKNKMGQGEQGDWHFLVCGSTDEEISNERTHWEVSHCWSKPILGGDHKVGTLTPPLASLLLHLHLQ